MTKPERDTPPGHTKPPINVSKNREGAAKLALIVDPRKLPKNAQLVLLISAALAFIIMMVDPEPMSTVSIVALFSIGAFAETRREDDPDEQRSLSQIYDRAFSHVVWLAVSMLPIIFLAIGLRRLFSLYVVPVE